MSIHLKYKFNFPSVVDCKNEKLNDYLLDFYPYSNNMHKKHNDVEIVDLKTQEKYIILLFTIFLKFRILQDKIQFPEYYKTNMASAWAE